MIGRCLCGAQTYFLSTAEYCPNEGPHKGGLLLRWVQNERQFFDAIERTWLGADKWPS